MRTYVRISPGRSAEGAAVVLLDLGDRRGAAGAVGGLEAELVERGLQGGLVARARDRRAAHGVDRGALLGEGARAQLRFGGARDLHGLRVVALELQRLHGGDPA